MGAREGPSSTRRRHAGVRRPLRFPDRTGEAPGYNPSARASRSPRTVTDGTTIHADSRRLGDGL